MVVHRVIRRFGMRTEGVTELISGGVFFYSGMITKESK